MNNPPNEISFGTDDASPISKEQVFVKSQPKIRRTKSPLISRNCPEFITPSKIRETSRRQLIKEDTSPKPLNRQNTAYFRTEDYSEVRQLFKELTKPSLQRGISGIGLTKKQLKPHCHVHKNSEAVTFCKKCGIDICRTCLPFHRNHVIDQEAMEKVPSVTELNPYKNSLQLLENAKYRAQKRRMQDISTQENSLSFFKNCVQCGNKAKFSEKISLQEFEKWGLCLKCQKSIFTTPVPEPSSEPVTFKSSLSDFQELAISSRICFVIGNERYESVEDYLNTVKSQDFWNTQKESIMETACYEKVKQHPKLVVLLLATLNRELMFYDAQDRYWGIGFNGLGQNKLGQILMKVRTRLRNN